MTTGCETNASLEYLDVWYEFTMPVTGNVVISNAQNTETFTLYDTCGGTELFCVVDDSIFYDLIAGTTYVMRYAERELFANASDFSIQALETAPNDECADATILNVSTVTPITITTDLRAASNDTEITCENNNTIEYLDVWYDITMPVDGELQVNNVNNSMFIAFFDACGGTELSCFNNDGSLFNVEAGKNLKMRASVRELFAGAYTFDVIAIPAPLPACSGTTEFIGGDWNNGIPDNTMNAIIRDNYNTSTTIDPISMMPFGNLEACSVSIDTGNTLTIAPEDYLEVTGNILVNGTLNIAHQASVIQLDPAAITTNNGTITVQTETGPLAARDFILAGSPMSGETRDGVYDDAIRVFAHNTANFNPNADVALEFPSAVNFADDNGDNYAQHTGVLNPGEGYLVKPQLTFNEPTQAYMHTFTQGTLNNGDYNFTVVFGDDQNDSPNVLANPYPSAILADDFINANSMIDEVYFWEHLTPASSDLPGYNGLNFSMEDISMYNLMGGVKASSDISPGNDTQPNGIISTSQGFGIKATAAGTAVFTNDMRRLTGNTTLRTTDENQNKMWLSITNPAYDLTSNTLIGFTKNATSQLDSGYDSNRLASILSIFSGIDDSEVELGIQSREPFNDAITIPVGFSSQLDESTLYRIGIDSIQGEQLPNVTIFLLDHTTGIKTNLTETQYEFVSEKGQFPNRFTLFFSDISLGTTSEILTDYTIAPNPGNGVFTINTNNQIIEEITVYDYLGRVIKSKNHLNVSETSIDISENANGIYLIKVKTASAALTKKYIKK